MMKPSERIWQRFLKKMIKQSTDIYRLENHVDAILEYLDEEYDKENKSKRSESISP